MVTVDHVTLLGQRCCGVWRISNKWAAHRTEGPISNLKVASMEAMYLLSSKKASRSASSGNVRRLNTLTSWPVCQGVHCDHHIIWSALGDTNSQTYAAHKVCTYAFWKGGTSGGDIKKDQWDHTKYKTKALCNLQMLSDSKSVGAKVCQLTVYAVRQLLTRIIASPSLPTHWTNITRKSQQMLSTWPHNSKAQRTLITSPNAPRNGEYTACLKLCTQLQPVSTICQPGS